MQDRKPSHLLLIVAFTAIYFVWGTTYIANLYGLSGFSPFILSALRYLIAGSLIMLWVKIRRIPVPTGKSLKVLSISGILMLVGGSGLIVFAEQYISSGYAAVIIATEPLLFVLLDKKRWREYLSNRVVVIGLLTGFAGITLFACCTPALKGNGNSGNLLLGTGIVLISAILWVTGTLYGSRHNQPAVHMLASTGVQLLAAALFSSLIALLNGEWKVFMPMHVAAHAWLGLLYLVVMGSLVAFFAFNWLVTVQPPAIVSTHTYVNPLVAILMGWLLAGEQISLMQLPGLIIAFAGVLLTQVGKIRAGRFTLA